MLVRDSHITCTSVGVPHITPTHVAGISAEVRGTQRGKIPGDEGGLSAALRICAGQAADRLPLKVRHPNLARHTLSPRERVPAKERESELQALADFIA